MKTAPMITLLNGLGSTERRAQPRLLARPSTLALDYYLQK